MKLLKQVVTVLGTVVVIAAIAALVTPKTAHALVATLVSVVGNVSVVNATSGGAAQPLLISDALNPAFSGSSTSYSCSFAGTTFCSAQVASPTASQITVVEFASGACNLVAGTRLIGAQLLIAEGGSFINTATYILPLVSFGSTFGLTNNWYEFEAPLKVYVRGSSGETLSLAATADQTEPNGQNCGFSVSSYTVTQ